MSAIPPTSLRRNDAVAQLRALPDLASRVRWLATAAPGEADLTALQEQAAALMGSDPPAAREVLAALAEAAGARGSEAVASRARYQLAQTHALAGQFEVALNLIQEAQAGMRRLGLRRDLLRTHLGRIHVLSELGRYGEAVEAAQEVIGAVAAQAEPDAGECRLAGLAWLNLGSCRWHCGAHEGALEAFAAAEGFLAKAGDDSRRPDIQSNRGLVLLELGRIREALTSFLAARAAAAGAGRRLLEGQALANAGRAHGALGEFAAALDALRESRRLLSDQNTQDIPILLRETADLYLGLNLFAEAGEAYAEAIGAFRASGARLHLAWALWGAGALARTTGDLDGADRALREAADLFTVTANGALLSGVLLEQAALLVERGDRAGAREVATRALILVASEELPVHQAFARLRRAEVLGSEPEAESELTDARELAVRVGLPQLLFRCDLRLGQLRRRQGRLAEAETCLRAALAQIEFLRGRIAQEALRVSFVGDKGEAYAELVSCLLAGGRGAEALVVAEQAKSRALLDLITGAVPATAAPDVADEDALRSELHAVYHHLLGAEGGGLSAARQAALRDRLGVLEKALAREPLAAVPAAAGEAGRPPELEEIQRFLDPSARLVVFFDLGPRLVAFVVSGQGAPHVVELGAVGSIRELLTRLRVSLDRCAQDAGLRARHGGVLEASCRRVLAELHARLIGPLGASLEGARRLTIVPHGPLHRVPFHALHDGSGYLIDRFEIGYAPSAAVWAHCQSRGQRPLSGALLAGYAAPGTPAVKRELAAVAALFPQHVLLEGERTTTRALREAGRGAAVVHLACHGVFRADNPLFSALHLGDGWLTAAELLGFNLDGALVTLSACETGSSQVTRGDETLGLARAALGAGAATVVVSGWRVDDATTATLMADFYSQLSVGGGRVEALRAAQLALKATHPHPWHWAAFSLSGRC